MSYTYDISDCWKRASASRTGVVFRKPLIIFWNSAPRVPLNRAIMPSFSAPIQSRKFSVDFSSGDCTTPPFGETPFGEAPSGDILSLATFAVANHAFNGDRIGRVKDEKRNWAALKRSEYLSLVNLFGVGYSPQGIRILMFLFVGHFCVTLVVVHIFFKYDKIWKLLE